MQPNYSQETLKNFIAFEGLDGSGTSTQSNLLLRNLMARGMAPVVTEEPSPGPVGMVIRTILKGRLRTGNDQRRTDQLLAHLFAADRHDHLYNDVDGVEGWLAEGKVVITTRYLFSSYAYNARTEEEFALVDRLNCGFPLPQVIVYLHQPVEVSLERIKHRGVHELYEKKEELERVAENFQRLFAPIEDRVVSLSAIGNPEDIAAKILDGVLSRIS